MSEIDSIYSIALKIGEITQMRSMVNPDSIWYWNYKAKVWRPDGEAF